MQEIIKNAMPDFLSGGGEMGKLIRSKDWSKTPLGSPDTWPQSLRTAISICIASNFPICISWGLHRVQIYNDGYWPITGDMHPVSMGQDFKECWHSAWPVIGQAFEEASLGATRFLETQRIFLDRYGYVEETFFTFSFSPILNESGAVGGLFHPVIEQTQQTLAERRLNILPAVANHTVNARTAKDASALIMNCLKDFELDIPFVLLYSITADGKEANLYGSVGVKKDSPLAPAKINLEESDLKSWSFNEVIQNGKAVQVENLAEIFGSFSCGPYPEPPEQALMFPVILSGTSHNNYFWVAGVSSRRRLDEKYLLFYDLLTASVTNILAKARAYEEERDKAEALAEIDRAKTVFFSNISHEFRTPLTLILSPLEELLNRKNNSFSESDNQNIQTTHRNAMRLLKLVNTLLDFSRIESGRQQAIFSLVDIVALTKNLAANFRSVMEKAGLELIVKADTAIQPVYVDRQMWEKIVFNLLSNAFKYTLEGSIIVEFSAEKDFAVLQVKDTGIGIPDNELPKMFERFHRVQNVTGRTYEGTGIGLSLIKELVQIHKGSISVESELNKGSVFTVKTPFGKEHLNGHQILTTEMGADEIAATIYVDEIETLIETDSNQKSTSISSTEKSTLPVVLVVDDNADMRQHIRSVLSKDFNVITANNGMDGLQKLKETVPALVLSDIMMPVMDGIGLLKEIKSNKATASIPVILLTARAGEESKIEGWETGADDYLVKPFSAKELLARVQAQIKIVKLRESLEDKVRNLFMEAPAIICVLRGPQHVFELANEIYLRLIGKRDVLEKTVREVMPELEGQGYLELLDNVYATGETSTGNEMPAQIDKGNGKLEEAYFNFVYQPTHNSEGKIDGVLLYGIDVTEQVLARKKIEESQNQLQNIFLNAPAAIAIFEGPQHKYILANKAYEKLSNRKAADLLGKSMEVLFPELIGTGTLELFDKVLETGESFSAPEYALMLDLRNEGVLRQYYFNFSMESLKNNSGEIYALMATTYDITESVEARKKIEETEKQEAFLLKLSDAIKELIDPVDIQLTACRILGEHVKVNRVLYTEVIDEELVVINNNYVNGVTPIIATLNAEQFGKNVIDAFKRNEKVIFSDINTDSRYTEDEKQSFLALNVVANVGMGLVKGGRWVATFGVHQNVPRNWTDSEILLMEETSERTWAAVERAKAEEALRKSEEKYRTLFTSIDQGFVFCELVRNKEGKGIDYYILEVNPTWEKQSGLSKEMVLGKTILQVFPTIDKGHIDTYAAVVDNQCPVVFEQYFEVNQRWHEVKVYPGEKDKFTVLFSDITERKLSEEKIKESEFRYYEMIYSSPSQMCILKGEDLIIEIANDAILESWGKGKDIIGKSLISVMPEIIEQGFEKLLLSVYKTGEPVYAYETPVTLIRNGKPELLHYTFIYQAQRNVNGEIEGVAIIANEVTPQVELKQQIKESEIRFRTMADASPVLIWTIDAGGLSSYYNKTFRDFIGVSQDEDISDWARIVHPEDVQFAFDTINTAMAERRSYALELRLLRADGQWRWVLSQGNPNVGANNEFLGFVGSSVDFTERKEAEVKIKESEKLLEQKVIERTEQLNEKNIELQKTNKELEAFTYISSHDLQEPLRKIQTFAGRIIATEKEQLSDTAKDYFRRMNDAATRMQTLIQDLLVFSRVNTSERKFEIADLAKIIDEVKEDFREAIEEKNATITTGEMCEANIIPFQVRQLMHNLIGNALKFSRKDIRPVISIESKKVSAANSPLNKPACHISVSDNGIGFGKEYSEKIFEVFQRLHSKEEYAGTGIGLAIVKKIVDNHNGIITAESEFGEGATFNIYIPV